MRTESALSCAQIGQQGGTRSGAGPVLGDLVALSLRGLREMYDGQRHEFAQSARRDPHSSSGLRTEGANLRYAAIVALGLGQVDVEQQRDVLAGMTAAEFAAVIAEQALDAADLGAVALAAWAAAEIAGAAPAAALNRLDHELGAGASVPTVVLAWALAAFVAAGDSVDFGDAAHRVCARLLAAQGGPGLFPHAVPAGSMGRHRSHVGCFADQVYPIQALARYYGATGERTALDAATRCADTIVDAQGSAGQWWWHYDTRTGGVVEGFPVYSVHQHAMGPMALFELQEAEGADHRAAVMRGLEWLRTHPETGEELIDPRRGVVWRKVGRREPRKAVRSVHALTTSMRPTMRLNALDRIFPAGPVDHECRPYELGWLLYAWLANRVRCSPSWDLAWPRR
jgi:hypothetical protein